MLEQLKKGKGTKTYFQPMEVTKKDFDDFINDTIDNYNKKIINNEFYAIEIGEIEISLPSSVVEHDYKKHKETLKDWKNIIEDISNIVEVNYTDTKNSYGEQSALIRLKDNKGITLTAGNNGRIFLTTGFNITNENEYNNWIAKTKKSNARIVNNNSPSTSLTDIINKLKSNVNKNNSTLKQDTFSTLPRGQISLTDTKATITLFEETHNPSTIIHETGHFFMKRIEVLAKNGYTKAMDVNKKMNSWLNGEIKRNDYKTNEEYDIAKQEYFARSFEAYLRRGIAPTKELKTIFETFRELLINIYNSIKELNVKLTPEVIDFFDRLIINNDIIDNNNIKGNEVFKKYQQLQEEIYREREEMVNNPLFENDEIENVLKEEYGERLNNLEKELTLYQKIEANAENNNTLNNTIDERLNKIEAEIQKGLEHKSNVLNDDFYNNLINYTKQNNNNNSFGYIKSISKYIKNCFRDTLASADEVINSIDPNLATKLKRMQTDVILMTDDNKKKALPFFKVLEHIKKTNQNDYLMLDFALKNRDVNKIQELANKYNFYNEYLAIRELLDTLREQALTVGIDVGYIENYFPRQVDPKKRMNLYLF